MGIRDAANLIHEARTRAGLTQFQMADGICSPNTLYRIEKRLSGVSPSTFQALMQRAGASWEMMPIFSNMQDFECYYALKHAHLYIQSWQLNDGYKELEFIEKMNWANNKFYYQEWLYLHCYLQFRSGMCNHHQNLEDLLYAISITYPSLNFENLAKTLFTVTEIHLLILIAEEYLYAANYDLCKKICTQLNIYFEKAEISLLEKEELIAENNLVYSKYLFATGNFQQALYIADTHRHHMASLSKGATLYELTFLTGLGYFHCNNLEKALLYMKNAFFSSHAVGSPYATICKTYMTTHLNYIVPNSILNAPVIPLIAYPTKKIISPSLSDGTYDFFSPDLVTVGKLIHILRKRQNISQAILCQGLCNESTLSKIENGSAQPSVFLAEALLQRLGISERCFVFSASSNYAKLYQLKFKLVRSQLRNIEEQISLISEMESLLTNDDILLKQFCMTQRALVSSSSTKEKIRKLYESLHLTFPDFSIEMLHTHRFTWEELSILNAIGFAYSDTDTPIIGINILKNISDYFDDTSCDILLCRNLKNFTLYALSSSLYSEKYFAELLELLSEKNYSILKTVPNNLAFFLFYYTQALGECNKLDVLPLFTNYACALQRILELDNNATILQNAIHRDFLVDINV